MALNFLGHVDDRALYGLVIEALRDARRLSPPPKLIDYHRFAYALVRLARPNEGGPELSGASQALSFNQGIFRFNSDAEELADNRRILTVLWTLIGQGLIYPRLFQKNDASAVEILSIGVTAAGERVLEQQFEHPLHPQFVQALRVARIADSVVAAIEDASACLQHGILRPAIAMAGVAFEETVEVAYGLEISASRVAPPPRPANARDRLAALLGSVDQRFAKVDERHRARTALTAAEVVRTERNNAAHPNVPANDRTLVEGLILQTATHVRALWDLYALPRQP